MRDLENIKGSRVYGRRQGQPLSAARQTRFDHWWPKVGIDLPPTPPQSPTPPAAYFGDQTAGLDQFWLEIGFGKGEHLAAQAAAHPDVGMLGCEPFLNGVSGLVDLIDAQNLGNIKIVMDDARLLIDSLPDASLARAFILFPDPWPKARHHKRRVVSPGNIAALARVLKDGAVLRIATDHREYCRWIMAHMLTSPDFIWVCAHPDDWQCRPADWPPSRYEQKALAQGRQNRYLQFIRRDR